MIPDAQAVTLISTVEDLVEKGSNVVTDGLNCYAGLTASGYSHTVSRHTPQVGKNLLPHVHRVASLLKRWLLGTHQGAVSHHRLQVDLDEFVFRFNRRSSPQWTALVTTLVDRAARLKTNHVPPWEDNMRSRLPARAAKCERRREHLQEPPV